MMYGDPDGLAVHLAVVPIVVNAGAALLPALMAGAVTFLSLLIKPRELVRACRKRPAIPVIVLAVGIGIAGLAWWLSSGEASPAQRRSRGGGAVTASVGMPIRIDWTQIALARIETRNRAGWVQAQAQPVVLSQETPRAGGEAFIFRGGPLRLGAIGAGPAGPMQIAWRFYPRFKDETGVEQVDTEAMILSSPAAHGGRVFGASCFLDPPKSFGAVFCADAATGRQVWSVDRADGEEFKGFFSSPAVTGDGRFVVIGQGLHPDSNCRLICVDALTGRVAWTVKVSLHIESSPAIEGDVVYVGCGAIEDPSSHKPLSHSGFVLAVRITDGKELWRFDVADPESSPVVQDGVLYIGSGFNGQAVVALRTATDEQLDQQGRQRLLWKTATPYPITGAITLVGEVVIAGGGNGDFVFRDPHPAGVVLALDRKTGLVLWKVDLPDAVLGAVSAGSYLICPVASGDVMALRPQDGSKVWTRRVSGNAPVLAAPAVTDQEVFAVSQDGYLARLSLAKGEVIDRTYLNAEARPGAQGLSISSPLVIAGRVFVGSETGGLCCLAGGQAR